MERSAGNEPTAWEDINPMVSAQPQEQRLPSSERLQPATSDHFRNELTACLALVAPAGMSEENRRDWLAVAWGTLKHLPADLLTLGCVEARKSCDHPAKIVPAIIAATEDSLKWRRDAVYSRPALPAPPCKKHILDRDRSTFTADDWAELSEHLKTMGSPVRYRSDGTRYTVEAA